MLEDSGYEDMQDAHSIDEEGSKLSNEGERTDRAISSINVSRPRSEDKRRSGSNNKKEKRSKISIGELSFSVDRVTSASERVAAKIHSFVGHEVLMLRHA
ncbi:Hypothetical predicted protein [Olea europaea subsp. europaea]|uniref:Uncharacterized protein n=1 Tax=Olea europaea subsp. europaea TaxID=158383 RepID=A0A8S0TF84_OLEEU|nr:Hypothetical predicted protein [Olea europaea subsp. europaea]